ncbi:A-kinase-interacting protein 1-like [Saccoglossus kowalevskii]|uniref:A-kinase-interacting protein 1-like n=1 Tax=Saccoglossus kowalevskii TaxID=10224 RepID=A0ABM0GNT7_SACKO|nr:PREDICTED: A-kinase-interacting protein 1-like [Saccoglossus kowalevskii]
MPCCSDDTWMACTLCRAGRRGLDTLNRVKERQITWPEPKPQQDYMIQDPAVYTTIDDAFSNIIQFMSSTSRQCKRYYQSSSSGSKSTRDKGHCCRFHTPQYSEVQKKNPLQTTEDVHVVVAPGTYAVTAGGWGTPRQQTHVVHVDRGQSVNLNFMM